MQDCTGVQGGSTDGLVKGGAVPRVQYERGERSAAGRLGGRPAVFLCTAEWISG